jgi:hypothetical protein
MTDYRPLLLVAALLSSTAIRAAEGGSLQEEIAVADGRLFAAIFDNCDASAVSAFSYAHVEGARPGAQSKPRAAYEGSR